VLVKISKKRLNNQVESMLSRLAKTTEKVWGITIYYYSTDIKVFFYIAGLFMAQE
jgi:hypothetical protein